MESTALMRTALACLTFAFLLSTTAIASDYYHSCADASGEFIITDGVLQAQRSATQSDDRPEIKFRETRRITIRREEGLCESKSCKRSFGFETETYLLFAEFEFEGRAQGATFICELAASGLPAACDCDSDRITYRQELKPAFTTKGKPLRGK
jgi:hypothetical protein